MKKRTNTDLLVAAKREGTQRVLRGRSRDPAWRSKSPPSSESPEVWAVLRLTGLKILVLGEGTVTLFCSPGADSKAHTAECRAPGTYQCSSGAGPESPRCLFCGLQDTAGLPGEPHVPLHPCDFLKGPSVWT